MRRPQVKGRKARIIFLVLGVPLVIIMLVAIVQNLTGNGPKRSDSPVSVPDTPSQPDKTRDVKKPPRSVPRTQVPEGVPPAVDAAAVEMENITAAAFLTPDLGQSSEEVRRQRQLMQAVLRQNAVPEVRQVLAESFSRSSALVRLAWGYESNQQIRAHSDYHMSVKLYRFIKRSLVSVGGQRRPEVVYWLVTESHWRLGNGQPRVQRNLRQVRLQLVGRSWLYKDSADLYPDISKDWRAVVERFGIDNFRRFNVYVKE